MSALRAIVGAGPRAVEQALFAELERLAPSTLEALAAAPGPVRVVVPSSSLRIHLLAELARRRPAWAGVEILTLRRLALLLFERAGEAPPRGGTLLPILVAREARKESELAGPLEPLEGGYATLVATVRDLVDAGLESIHGHPFAELIAADDVRIALADRPRAAAVARVAQRTAQELERLGLAPGATLLRRAADLLAGRPDLLPPAAAWIVHGFADATGSALDLLETLSRWGPTMLLLDLPESAVGAPRDSGESFGSGLRGRLQQGRRGESAPAIARAELEAFSARGESAEAREVARRIRTDLAANPQLRPETIGVVARDLHAHLAALRRAFEAAAIPFSVEGAGGADPARREVASLVRLLDRGTAAEADLAIDLLAPGQHGAVGSAELRVALRVLGVATLADFAALEESTLPDVRLPLRNVENDEEGHGVLRVRRYPRARLAAWAAAARELERGLGRFPEKGHVSAMIRALHGLAHRALPAGGAARRWLEATARELAVDLPEDFWLGRDEVAELLGRAAEALPELAVGGAGGGVQLLSVTAARARTFERLYLVGLRRGAFPRSVTDDPLLPDGVRREARTVLLELPVKAEGHAEERFLFDQLLAAAPRVVLSFPALSDDGSERLVSPLLDRLSWRDAATRALREQWRTPVGSNPMPSAGLPAAPSDVARRAGLERRRSGWVAALPAALAEARGGAVVSIEERELARFRAAVIEELDVDPHTPRGKQRWERLGPFFGRVGPLPEERLFVTRVERVISCAWLDFLTRRLGLEPLPDPAASLPEPLDAVRIGIATHRVLDELFTASLRAQGPPPADWTAPEPVPAEIPFPELERVRHHAREVARGLLQEEGLARWGFESLFAEALLERIEVARADFGAGRRVVGVEVEGEADLSRHGAPIRLLFRADRVDREAERLVLTDYKTGRAKSITDLARPGKLAQAIATGRSLQPAAYVAALSGRPATGRLLALGPADDEAAVRVATLDEGAGVALAGLAHAAAVAAAALATGRLLPRLVDASGEQRGPACARCELVEACIQEDSTARGRLARWAAKVRAARARGGAPDPTAPAGAEGDRAEADLFLLPETELDEGPEGAP
jgi:hypothetical protein